MVLLALIVPGFARAAVVSAPNEISTGDGSAHSSVEQQLLARENVGVGTDTPVARLDIFDNSDYGFGEKVAIRRLGPGDVGISLQQNGISSFGIVHRAGVSGGLSFVNNYYENSPGNDLVRILGTGQVGIGTIKPASLLHVAGQIRTDEAFLYKGLIGISDAEIGVPTKMSVSGGIITGISKTKGATKAIRLQGAQEGEVCTLIIENGVIIDATCVVEDKGDNKKKLLWGWLRVF
jgi:hypothetical protein